jgi:hypothetical protein
MAGLTFYKSDALPTELCRLAVADKTPLGLFRKAGKRF